MTRYMVFRSASSSHHLCVCAARDRGHALRIARRMFRIERTGYAVPERAE